MRDTPPPCAEPGKRSTLLDDSVERGWDKTEMDVWTVTVDFDFRLSAPSIQTTILYLREEDNEYLPRG